MAKQKNPFGQFFSSLYLTITLLVLIVALSVAGTFIPQQEAAREFARGISPGLATFLQSMQLFDLFHSVWFFLLMFLLFINLVVCSLKRWPVTWKQFRASPFSAGEAELFRDLAGDRILWLPQDTGEVSGELEQILRRKYRQVEKKVQEGGAVIFCGEKGKYSRFAVYIVHLSVLILILGAVIGAFWGWEGYVNIGEGEQAVSIDLRGGRGVLPLPFAIRCDRFVVEFYANGAPKTYRSDLTFLKDNQAIYQGPLLVNHPISLEGLRIYQSSYGRSPEGRAALTFSRSGKPARNFSLGDGETFSLPEQEGAVQAVRIEENLMQMGPAVKLLVRSGNQEVSFWVFQHIDRIREMNPGVTEQVPIFNPALFKPYVFALTGLEERYYTGLQVQRDPGAPLAGVAAVLMIAGLTGTFFTSHRRVWIMVQRSGEKTKVSIAARSNKHPVVMDREVRRLRERIIAAMEVKST